MARDPKYPDAWDTETSMHDAEDERPATGESGEDLRDDERPADTDDEPVVADDLVSGEEGYIEPPD